MHIYHVSTLCWQSLFPFITWGSILFRICAVYHYIMYVFCQLLKAIYPAFVLEAT